MARQRDIARREIRVDMASVDDAKARELLERYGRLANRISRSLIGDQEELEAVARVAIIEGYLTCNPKRVPEPQWIAIVIRHRVIEAWQRDVQRLSTVVTQSAMSAQRWESAEPRTNGVSHPDKFIALYPAFQAMAYLEPRAQAILQGRIHGYTFEELGNKLGLSTSRVHQAYQKAVEVLREAVRVGEP